MNDAERKLFLGGRLKRLRRDLGLTQTKMAEDLGVSPSYLNHLERNQRPLTAQVLLRLAQAYDLDLRTLTQDPDVGGEAELSEVFADPMFRDMTIPRHEVNELAENAPGIASALVRLYRSFTDQRRARALLGDPLETLGSDDADGRDIALSATPSDWVRDFMQGHKNGFPDLDQAGEALHESLNLQGAHTFEIEATARLKARHGISVRILSTQIMVDYQRRFDPHRRRLLLAETLGPASRAFALAYQLALSEEGARINTLCDSADAPDLATKRLLKVSLINYLAGAIVMPQGSFARAAEETGYDLALLQARFGTSFEQVCHRLTTLAHRPLTTGSPSQTRPVPFFLIRVDQAGNISKRFAAGAFPFSRLGGTCPRWNVHSAFKTPGRFLTQIIETPDGARYFTLSRTLDPGTHAFGQGDEAERAIGLGCELKYAHRLVYARGLNLDDPAITEIGPTCRLCERPHCKERAGPPLTRTLNIDEWSKSLSPFPF